MDYLKKAWDWLSGKKTWIGLAIAFISGGLSATGVIDAATHAKVMAFAAVVAGGGLVHKKLKGEL